MLNFIKKYFWTLFWIVMLFLVIFVFRIVNVQGDSMYPTIEDESWALVLKNFYTIEQGDIIIADQDGKYVIKRVIGCPGDTVLITEEGEIYVNGELYDQDDDAYLPTEYCGVEITLDEDEYYIMGDNRAVSKDSRIVGPETKIYGKVILYF